MRAADDYAAIADRQRELLKPAPTRCTCTVNGRYIYRHNGNLKMLLPDPRCALHGGVITKPAAGFDPADWVGLGSEADADAGRG